MKLNNPTIRAIIGVSLIVLGLVFIFISIITAIIRIKYEYTQVSTVETENVSNHTTANNLLHNDHNEPVYNSNIIESNEAYPRAINNRRNNSFIIFIRAFNTYYNRLLILIGLIAIIKGIYMLSVDKKQEKILPCRGIIKNKSCNTLRNNEHSLISSKQHSYLISKALQMQKSDKSLSDPFDTPHTSYDYNEHSYDYRPKEK
ncbi:hypothetical protein NEIG_00727 [Nematocida sp. ERTm5]|nr:hypothetical protein NEIG_00727 [Nematocida sp. ERTm5]